MPMIKLVDIKKDYQLGDSVFEALKGINFEIQAGELVAIVGPSGSGKTTTMQIMGLLDRATSGKYYLDDTDTTGFSDDELAAFRNTRLGFVFQGFLLLPKLNAIENVMLPLRYRHGENISIADARDRAQKILEKVGMGKFGHHKPGELSGGQQQRVAIARALVGKPSLIIADEPTGALDTKTAREIMNLFEEQLSVSGTTVVIVTHSLDVAKECHRSIKIKDGQIVNEL